MCNDGSPGVFYVRPGMGADVDKWIIHTQGGGACTAYETCLERCQDEIGTRPLFRDEESLEALFEARRADYAAAAFTVESLGRNPEIIADDVIQRLEDAIWSSESFR